MRPKTILVNPPLWNAYSPHLAVPLLAGVLADRNWPVDSYDIGIESLDWILSPEGLLAVSALLESTVANGEPDDRARARRALMLLPRTLASIDEAKAIHRSLAAFDDPDRLRDATTTMRNAMWCVSAAFKGLTFDLVANDLYHSARSTEDVLAATADQDRNVYAWAFDRMGLASVVDDADIGAVGISVSADTQLIAALTFARTVRKARPDVHIVMGGNFTTRMVSRWNEVHPFFDLVDSFVLYEGEESLPALLENLFEGSAEPVPGLVDIVDGSLCKRESRKVGLDDLPIPDFSQLPLDRYFAPGPILPTYASRSCAWECAFCSIPFASNRFRARTAERVVDEIEYLAKTYDTEYFFLVDEILTIRSMSEVSRELIDRGTNIFWYGETRFAPSLNREMADQLYASGCRRLSVGLESYSQRVLDLMNKGTKVEWIEPNIDAYLNAGIPLHLFCIIGFPGEEPDEAEQTIDYARSVCARAESHYGVAHTTWGAAPFVLDVHSPVGQDPSSFGVKLRARPESEDLALTVQFEVAQGLSQEDSWRAMRNIHGTVDSTANSGGNRDREGFWFERQVRHSIEERLFLRACHGKGPELLDWRRPPPLSVKPDEPVEWNGGAVVGALREDDPPTLYAYSGEVDAAVALRGLTHDDVSSLMAAGTRAERVGRLNRGHRELAPDEIDAMLRQLERFGFYRPAASTVTSNGSNGDGPTNTRRGSLFRREPMTHGSFDPESIRCSVASEISGRVMTVRPRSYGLYLLCDPALRVDDPRLIEIGFEAGDRAALDAELEDLIARGLIYVEEES